MRKGAMLLALLVLGATAVQAQTTTHINVNVGDPAFATFYMRTTGSEVGDTVVLYRCDPNVSKGIYFTNYDTNQMTSTEFDITCDSSVEYVNGVRVASFTVKGTPFTFNANGGTVTVNSASWQASLGRWWRNPVGSTTITVN